LEFVVPATSIAIANNEIYITSDSAGLCKVSRFKGHSVEDIISIRGSPCVAIGSSLDSLLVSVGETLYIVSGNEAKPVLKAKPGNWFWHSVEGCGNVFVQEYGEPPTGIYMSEDLTHFRRVITNNAIDPLSKHFHYITFDWKRELLVATLGDGNVVRVTVSGDCGSTWKPLYKGPWQFVPVLIDNDKWILGFDSGIARGGVATYNTEVDRWSFVFLKADGYRYAQFSSITKFGNYYIGCLGYPTAIVTSKDMLHWYPLYLDKASASYNHFVNASVWRDSVIATTGKELLILDSRDIEEAFKKKPFLTPYKARLDRIRGFVYMLKRFPWMLKL